jgi:transcription elongation factor GreA
VRGEALSALRGAHGERWPRLWAQWMLREDSPGLLGSICQALVAAGASETLSQAVDTVMRSHNDYPAQFVWAAETMTEPGCPEAIARHLGPSLLEKIPDALIRPEYSVLRGRAKGLLDGGKAAIRVILEQATPQQAERFAQRIGRLDVVEMQRAKLVARAAQQRQGTAQRDTRPLLVATRRAITAKQAELKQLVEVEIPKTLKGINAAAAEGDLRENFEYHMLRDRQELQSARAAKIQTELAAVRTLEPGAADTSRVNIGTVVHLADLDGTALAPVTILGPWDADVDRRIFANGTDLAEGLLGRTVGTEVTVEGRAARITAIVAWTEES